MENRKHLKSEVLLEWLLLVVSVGYNTSSFLKEKYFFSLTGYILSYP